jgi:acyl-CoA thioester hydrolase
VSIETRRPLEVSLEFPVRTYDIDFAGVVSNIVYIRWLEDLRLTVLDRHYPLEKLLADRLAPTLVETHIRYRHPITIADKARGRMWVSRISRLKFTFEAEILANGQVAVTAEQVGCLIDLSNGRPAPMPEELRQKFQESRRDPYEPS